MAVSPTSTWDQSRAESPLLSLLLRGADPPSFATFAGACGNKKKLGDVLHKLDEPSLTRLIPLTWLRDRASKEACQKTALAMVTSHNARGVFLSRISETPSAQRMKTVRRYPHPNHVRGLAQCD